MASAIPGLDVTEYGHVDPNTVPNPTKMPTAGGLRRLVDTATNSLPAQRLREASGYVNGTTEPGPMPAARTGLRGAFDTAGNVASKAVRVGGAVAAVAPAAVDTYKVARDDKTSKLDVATQAAEGTGKAASAWLGGQAGATAGAAAGAMTGPLAPVAIPVGAALGGVVGGTAGYFGADKAIKTLRGAVGTDERSPLEQMQARTALPVAPTASGPGIQPFTPSTAGAGRGSINPEQRDPEKYRADFTGALGSVPRDLPGIDAGLVYKTKDANGRTVYSGKDVQAGASIVDGKRNLTGNLRDEFYPGAPGAGSTGMSSSAPTYSGGDAPLATGNGGLGGFNTSRSGNMLSRDPEQQRRDAETQASSIVAQTRSNGLRNLEGLDKQDIATTQANAQRYGADAGLRGHMYAADQQLKGTLANANAQSLRTSMEMNMKYGQRQLMAQIYQKAGGDLAVAKKMALANGLDPQTFEQALAADQASTAKTQDTQAQASDRVRADMKAYVADKDGKMIEDPAASQAKFDAMRQVFPGITGTDPAYYDQHSPKIKALGGIYDKVRTMPQMGLDKLNPFNTPDTPLSAMPNWQGGKLTRASGLQGPLTPGIANGDYYMTTKDGRDIPLGQLDEAQVNLIREHTKTGKWHNK